MCGCQGLGGGKQVDGAQRIFRAVKILYMMFAVMDTRHYYIFPNP